MNQDSLSPCRVCGHMVSKNADNCPNCGELEPFKCGELEPFKKEEIETLPDPNLLLPCCVCGHKITKYAESCPNCGEPEPYREAIKKWKKEKEYKDKYEGIKNNLQLIFPIIYILLLVVCITWIDVWNSNFTLFVVASFVWIPIHFFIWCITIHTWSAFDFPFERECFYCYPIEFGLFWVSTYATIPAIGNLLKWL